MQVSTADNHYKSLSPTTDDLHENVDVYNVADDVYDELPKPRDTANRQQRAMSNKYTELKINQKNFSEIRTQKEGNGRVKGQRL